MSEHTYINNQFLFSMPNLADPFFAETVTYICEHNENGAVGLVINRPLSIHLKEVLRQLAIDTEFEDIATMPVLYGGPVQQDRGFVLHSNSKHYRETIATSDSLAVTTSRDILESFAKHDGPMPSLVTLGYAGWGPGQLEKEIGNNCWLHCPFDQRILFHAPFKDRWRLAAQSIGIDPDFLLTEAGHA